MYNELMKQLLDLAAEMNKAENALLIHDAVDAIDELNVIVRAQKAVLDKIPKWTPVTERSPKNAGKYLCRIKSFDGKFRYTDTLKYVDGFFYERGVAIDRVTYWRPLPEPPEEES